MRKHHLIIISIISAAAFGFSACQNKNNVDAQTHNPNVQAQTDTLSRDILINAVKQEGYVSNIDVSHITDMSFVFRGATAFNQPIKTWNVSQVTHMHGMFFDAKSFNQPIGNWNTANVKNMSEMFLHAETFNQPLEQWNVAKVTDMSSMFYHASAFNQPIGKWNVQNVTDMSAMFWNATLFNQPIGKWNTANVTDMSGMFYQAETFNQPIENWNVQNVKNMNAMFYHAFAFNQPIEKWNVQNVQNMKNMFSGAKAFNQPIGNWNVQNVTDMSALFSEAEAFNQPIGKWNVQNVTDMSKMFWGAQAFNQDLSTWNVRNVTDMNEMFYHAKTFNQPIGNWNVTHVKDMSEMFAYCQNFNQPIEYWNVSNVQNMHGMFWNADTFNQPIGNWNVQNVTDMSGMFWGAAEFNQDLSAWNVYNVQNMNLMFSGATTFNQDLSAWNVQNVKDISSMFEDATAFNQDLSTWNVSKVENATHIFKNSGLSQENYCKMITTNAGWKQLNQKFHLGISYPCDGIYEGFAAQCSTQSLPENIRKQWHINENGEWICQNEKGCDFCHQHYLGNVHIENHIVMCGNKEAILENTKCHDMRILYQEDEAYLKKFQQRHHVHVADHNNITWKSIENHFPLPMLQTHDSEDIILQFNTFLNQHNNHANTFKYECAIHQTNINDKGLTVHLIKCHAEDDNHEFKEKYYISSHLPNSNQFKTYAIENKSNTNKPNLLESNANLLDENIQLINVISAPFLDTTATYIRILKHTSITHEDTKGSQDSYIYKTFLFAGDKHQLVGSWNDTVYHQKYAIHEDSLNLHDSNLHPIFNVIDSYEENTAYLDGHTLKFTPQKFTSRQEFLKHKEFEKNTEKTPNPIKAQKIPK